MLTEKGVYVDATDSRFNAPIPMAVVSLYILTLTTSLSPSTGPNW